MSADTEQDRVLQQKESNTAILTLNRPDKKNAITRAMYLNLVDALREAEHDTDVKSVVLAGQGACFTSGNDLGDFAESGLGSEAAGLDSDSNPVLTFLDAYRKFPKPIIVAVHGDAVGIGTTLLLHSDLCYASSDALFSLPFVKLGLCPEFASSYLLPRLAGHVKAFEWLVLGQSFGAAEAQAFGLINAVVEEPFEHALTVARSFANLPPKAVVEAKRLIKSASIKPVDQCMVDEVKQFSQALQGREFAEAVTAFFEKRQAVYK